MEGTTRERFPFRLILTLHDLSHVPTASFFSRSGAVHVRVVAQRTTLAKSSAVRRGAVGGTGGVKWEGGCKLSVSLLHTSFILHLVICDSDGAHIGRASLDVRTVTRDVTATHQLPVAFTSSTMQDSRLTVTVKIETAGLSSPLTAPLTSGLGPTEDLSQNLCYVLNAGRECVPAGYTGCHNAAFRNSLLARRVSDEDADSSLCRLDRLEDLFQDSYLLTRQVCSSRSSAHITGSLRAMPFGTLRSVRVPHFLCSQTTRIELAKSSGTEDCYTIPAGMILSVQPDLHIWTAYAADPFMTKERHVLKLETLVASSYGYDTKYTFVKCESIYSSWALMRMLHRVVHHESTLAHQKVARTLCNPYIWTKEGCTLPSPCIPATVLAPANNIPVATRCGVTVNDISGSGPSTLSFSPFAEGYDSLNTFADNVLDLASLTAVEINSDYLCSGEYLLRVEITAGDLGCLKSYFYELLPVTYVIAKCSGLTACKSVNLHRSGGLSDAIYKVNFEKPAEHFDEEQVLQLPDGGFFLLLTEEDIRGARCSKGKGLMLVLYHGTIGAEHVVGEQFLPLYKILPPEIRGQLESVGSSLPDIVLQRSDVNQSKPNDSSGFGTEEIRGKNEREGLDTVPRCGASNSLLSSYSVNVPLDSRLSFQFKIVSGVVYDSTKSRHDGNGINVMKLGRYMSILCHVVMWNGRRPTASLDKYLKQQSLHSSPSPWNADTEFSFTTDDGIHLGDMIRIKLIDSYDLESAGVVYIPLSDFELKSSFSEAPTRTYPIVPCTYKLDDRTPSREVQSGIGTISVNLSRRQSTFPDNRMGAPNINLRCSCALASEHTSRWPGYSILSSAMHSFDASDMSETVHMSLFYDGALIELSTVNCGEDDDDDQNNNDMGSRFHRRSTLESLDEDISDWIHLADESQTTSTMNSRSAELRKNLNSVLATCEERSNMSVPVVFVPWSQISHVDVITPSVLSVRLTVHRYLGGGLDVDDGVRNTFRAAEVEVFLCPCNSRKLFAAIEERIRAFPSRQSVKAALSEELRGHGQTDGTVVGPMSPAISAIAFVSQRMSDLSSDINKCRASGVTSEDVDSLLYVLDNSSDCRGRVVRGFVFQSTPHYRNLRSVQVSSDTFKMISLLREQCRMWLYIAAVASAYQHYIPPDHCTFSENTLLDQIEQDFMAAERQIYQEIDYAKLHNTASEENACMGTISEVKSSRCHISLLTSDLLVRRLRDAALALWANKRVPSVTCMCNLLDVIVHRYFLEVTRVLSRYFRHDGRALDAEPGKQAYQSTSKLHLVSIFTEMNDCFRNAVRCSLGTFNIGLRNSVPSTLNETVNTSSDNVSEVLLLSSVFNVNDLVADFSTILLREMKQWVVRTVSTWRKKAENESSFLCTMLPWFPVRLEQSLRQKLERDVSNLRRQRAGQRFLTLIPEDVALALNQYLEDCMLVSGTSNCEDDLDKLSQDNMGFITKVALKVRLLYATSFLYLSQAYDDALSEVRNVLAGAGVCCVGPKKAYRGTIFRFREDTKCRSGGCNVTKDELLDECAVWLCSCANDMYRAGKKHFAASFDIASQHAYDENDTESTDTDSDEEWDGVGIVGDAVRKTEVSFGQVMYNCIRTIGDLIMFSVSDIFERDKFAALWINHVSRAVNSPGKYMLSSSRTRAINSESGPICHGLFVIESFLKNYEAWLEPLCYAQLLRECLHRLNVVYLTFLKDLSEEHPVRPLCLDSVKQVAKDEADIKRFFTSLGSVRSASNRRLQHSIRHLNYLNVCSTHICTEICNDICELNFPLTNISRLLCCDIYSEEFVIVTQNLVSVAKSHPADASALARMMRAIVSLRADMHCTDDSIDTEKRQVVLQAYELSIRSQSQSETAGYGVALSSSVAKVFAPEFIPQHNMPSLSIVSGITSRQEPQQAFRESLIEVSCIRITGFSPANAERVMGSLLGVGTGVVSLLLAMRLEDSSERGTLDALDTYESTLLPIYYSYDTNEWVPRTTGDSAVNLPCSGGYAHKDLVCELQSKSFIRGRIVLVGRTTMSLGGIDTTTTTFEGIIELLRISSSELDAEAKLLFSVKLKAGSRGL